jgi:hypothetical protein
MGFLISFSFFFLAIVINQSTVVGQTTAESVIEFPKNDIRDISQTISGSVNLPFPSNETVKQDIVVIALNRKNAVVYYNITQPAPPSDVHSHAFIHYNNGVTEYNEIWTSL